MGSAYRQSARNFSPLACRCETIQAEKGSAVHDNVADLDHSTQANQILVIDFVLPEKLGVVTEIAQEPVEFPERSGRAVEATGNQVSREFFRFKDREAEKIKGFSRVPSMIGTFDPNQEQAVANFSRERLVCRV